MKIRWVPLCFALLFLASNAFAVPPTVDFNWVVNGVLNGSAITLQNVIFDPEIASVLEVRNMQWQFGLDGNVNYFTGDLNTVFDENFDAGIGAWTISSGTWVSTVGGLEAQNTGGSALIYRSFDLNFLNNTADLNFSFLFRPKSAGSGPMIKFAAQGTGLTDDSYLVSADVGGTILLQKYVSGNRETIYNTGTTVVADTNYGIDIVRRTDANWLVYVNGVLDGSATDSTYSAMSHIVIRETGTAPQSSFYDNFKYNYGTDVIDSDRNENHAFTTATVQDVCLTAGNTDGNSTTCHSITVSGGLNLRFFDENTGLIILNPTVYVNDVNQNVTNGDLNYSLSGVSTPTDFTVRASTETKPERTFFFAGLTSTSYIEKQVYLLDSNKGKQIEFQFYEPNKTTLLSNAIVSFIRTGTIRYAEIQKLDSSAKADFFVNHDANYFLDIDSGADGNSDYNYFSVVLTVQKPKDEKTGAFITPFEIVISGLASYDVNGLTDANTFPIFSNTVDYYNVQVLADGNAELLYLLPRYYLIRTRGAPATETLQPYLAADVDSAFNSVLTTIDFFNRFPLQNIIIRSYSSTTDGVKLVENRKTDSTGKAAFSFILSKEYTLYFDTNETIQRNIGTVVINAISSTYFFALQSGTIDLNVYQTSPADYNYLQSYIQLSASNLFDLNWTVFSSTPTITNVNWHVFDSVGTTLINRTIPLSATALHSDGNTFSYTKTDQNIFIVSVLTITTNGIDVNFIKTFPIYSSTEKPLQQVALELGNILGNFGTTLVAVLVALFVHGFAAGGRPDLNTNGLFALVAVVVGFFTALGWVSLANFFLAALFGAGSWLYANRG